MENKAAIGLLIFVVITYGGMMAYQFKHNQKTEEQPTVEENWKWDDNWNLPKKEESKEEKEEPKQDNKQIVAKDYADAIQQSAQTGKPILIEFTAEWCHWCSKMEEQTLVDPNVVELLKNYILVKVDSDKDRVLTTKFGVPSLPAYVITNSKEEKLDFSVGFMKADAFSNWLSNPKILVLPKSNEKKAEPVLPNNENMSRKHSRRINRRS